MRIAILSPCLLLSLVPLSAQGPILDYLAPGGETVLRTDSTVLQPVQGPPITVHGGLFTFRSVTIPQGSTLRGQGPNPMIWICDTMTVAGELTVSGADGSKVFTLSSANFPEPGGRGGAGGGDGGTGSPQIGMRSFAGRAGNGPGNAAGLGGTGGLVGSFTVGRGSGGGGGAFATSGDPYHLQPFLGGTSFQQVLGLGGQGGIGVSGSATRSIAGGGPGGTPFTDSDDENDFFGLGYDVFRRRWVQGELGLPVGGSGGGGGGDRGNSAGPLSPQWIADAKGGGGGGGGGCLIVFAQNLLVVSGRVTANGGNGGGGEQAGSCNQGGGGGGGSGGMVILASRGRIELHVRGETYQNRDYDFCVSADGGVCTTGSFGAPYVGGKYPLNGQLPMAGGVYDSAPLGGFGGLGVIELAAPPGTNTDGTNTVLDDNIHLFRNGLPLTGAPKQRFLAWRGWKNLQGIRVDDAGAAVTIGTGEGDLRPSPILIPL